LRLCPLFAGIPFAGCGEKTRLFDVEGGEKDTFGEEERRGSDGVRARELERRGWSCARPSEKASFAGIVIPLTRTNAHKRGVTKVHRSHPKCCSVWLRCASGSRSIQYLNHTKAVIWAQSTCIASMAWFLGRHI
jgi:hypothetical protein